MLWLALYCPTLALDCILRRWPAGIEPAMAVTETEGPRRFVSAATATAQACGVFAGQSVSTALALLPDLVVVARKFDDERRALMDAALAALRFTPTVSLRGSGLVMEVSASLRLFGGRRAFGKSLAAAMKVQGLGMSTAEAPTPHGAWLLAKQKALRHFQATKAALRQLPGQRSSTRSKEKTAVVDFDKALGDVPVRLLESLEATSHRMTGIGVRKVADLWCLPTGGLARRFGQEVIDEVARARGTRPDPQSVFVAPEHFEARLELMARVESVEALAFGAERLLEQLSGWLTVRRAAVRGFELILHHDRWTRDAIPPTMVAIAVATPSNDPHRLLVLVRERLARLELKAPVLELSIAAPTIVAEQEAHGALFPAREQAAETLARLLEKLIARLGDESMTRIERVEGHRPENAWREVPADLLASPAAETPGARHAGAMRTKGARAASRKRVLPSKSVVTAAAESRPVPERVDLKKHDCEAHVRTEPQRAEGPDPRAHSKVGALRSGGASGSSLRSLKMDQLDSALASRIDAATCDFLRAIGISAGLRFTHSPDESKRRSPIESAPSVASAPDSLPAAEQAFCAPIVLQDGIGPDRPGDPRPAWLLSEPQPLTMQRDYPVYESLPLSLLAGPERIETGWWEDSTATRDYFIAHNATGHLVWIYRERMLKENRPSWYLQGLFG